MSDHELANTLAAVVDQLRERGLLTESYTRSARSLSSFVRRVVNARIADQVIAGRPATADEKATILNQ